MLVHFSEHISSTTLLNKLRNATFEKHDDTFYSKNLYVSLWNKWTKKLEEKIILGAELNFESYILWNIKNLELLDNNVRSKVLYHAARYNNTKIINLILPKGTHYYRSRIYWGDVLLGAWAGEHKLLINQARAMNIEVTEKHLQMSICYDTLEAATLMIEKSNIADKYQVATSIALVKNRQDIINYFLKTGHYYCDIFANAALLRACEKGYLDTVKLAHSRLQKYSSSTYDFEINIKTAKEFGNFEIVKFLESVRLWQALSLNHLRISDCLGAVMFSN